MVRHILKDGRELKDIRGHIVKAEDAKTAYKVIDELNEERMKENDRKNDD